MRSYNCLKRAGIQTVGDLVSKTESELNAIPNFGKKSIDEVIETLHARGLGLRERVRSCRVMRHQRQRYQLSRSASHRKALLMNLSKEVIEHERIQTTEAKAKAVKPEVEKLITLAKRGDLHARRQALSALGQDKFAVYKLFEEIAPRYTERPGRLHADPEARARGGRTRPRWCCWSSCSSGLPDGVPAAARVRRDRVSPAGRAQPGVRTVQAELERALASCCARDAVAADGGRPDRRRRPRLGPGGELRRRRRRASASLNALLPADVAVLSCCEAAPPGSTPAATPPRGPTATGCWCARRARRARARPGAALAPPGRLSTRCDACAAALVGDARLHRVHADRDRPRALLTARCWRRSGARARAAASCSSSGSRRTRSCAT